MFFGHPETMGYVLGVPAGLAVAWRCGYRAIPFRGIRGAVGWAMVAIVVDTVVKGGATDPGRVALAAFLGAVFFGYLFGAAGRCLWQDWRHRGDDGRGGGDDDGPAGDPDGPGGRELCHLMDQFEAETKAPAMPEPVRVA